MCFHLNQEILLRTLIMETNENTLHLVLATVKCITPLSFVFCVLILLCMEKSVFVNLVIKDPGGV